MKIHTEEECTTKLKAIKFILENAKRSAKEIEVIHMCDSVIQLADELLGEMENV